MEKTSRKLKRITAAILLLVFITLTFAGCSSTGSRSPEELVKRFINALFAFDGSEVTDCILPELSAMYKGAVRLAAAVTGTDPEKQIAEDFFAEMENTYGIQISDPSDVKVQVVLISKEQSKITATVRALIIMEINERYEYVDGYFVTSMIGSRWYFANMFEHEPAGYTPTKIFVDQVSVENMKNGLEQNRLTAVSEKDSAYLNGMISNAVIKNEVEETLSKLYGIYLSKETKTATGAERMFAMGFINTLFDTFSVGNDVMGEKGLIRGQDIVQDIAFSIMKEDMAELSDAMDALSYLSQTVGMIQSGTRSSVNALHSSDVRDVLEAAESSPHLLYFARKVMDDPSLRQKYDRIIDGKSNMIFGDMTSLYAYTTIMRRLELGLSVADTTITYVNNISEYEIAKGFANLYLDDLRRLRSTTSNTRLQNDIDRYIASIEGGLIEKIKGYIGVRNTAEGVKFTFDNVQAVYTLSKNGFFGSRIQAAAGKLTSSDAISMFAEAVAYAEFVTSAPGLLAGLFGYDSEEMVKRLDELSSLFPVFKSELDYVFDFGKVTDANYGAYADHYYLCLILGKAWCNSALQECYASMNFLEKDGLWAMSDVRKCAIELEAYMEDFDKALDNINSDYLKYVAEFCGSVWEVNM